MIRGIRIEVTKKTKKDRRRVKSTKTSSAKEEKKSCSKNTMKSRRLQVMK